MPVHQSKAYKKFFFSVEWQTCKIPFHQRTMTEVYAPDWYFTSVPHSFQFQAFARVSGILIDINKFTEPPNGWISLVSSDKSLILSQIEKKKISDSLPIISQCVGKGYSTYFAHHHCNRGTLGTCSQFTHKNVRFFIIPLKEFSIF